MHNHFVLGMELCFGCGGNHLFFFFFGDNVFVETVGDDDSLA